MNVDLQYLKFWIWRLVYWDYNSRNDSTSGFINETVHSCHSPVAASCHEGSDCKKLWRDMLLRCAVQWPPHGLRAGRQQHFSEAVPLRQDACMAQRAQGMPDDSEHHWNACFTGTQRVLRETFKGRPEGVCWCCSSRHHSCYTGCYTYFHMHFLWLLSLWMCWQMADTGIWWRSNSIKMWSFVSRIRKIHSAKIWIHVTSTKYKRINSVTAALVLVANKNRLVFLKSVMKLWFI